MPITSLLFSSNLPDAATMQIPLTAKQGTVSVTAQAGPCKLKVWAPGHGGAYLCLKDGKPKLLGLDGALGPAFPLKALVQGIKGLSPALCQPRSLVGAEERPLCIGFHPSHEQVIHPQAVEEISGPDLQPRQVADYIFPELLHKCSSATSIAVIYACASPHSCRKGSNALATTEICII